MRNTRNLKFRIYGFEVRCAAKISDGLVAGKNKQYILRELKKELIAFSRTVKLQKDELNFLWNTCVTEYVTVSKQVWGKRTDKKRVYLAIKSTLPVLEKVKNEVGRKVETEDKQNYLDRLTSRGVFYLCSCHSKCAVGHQEYQGRMYVCQDWESRIDDTVLKRKVAAYIRNHNCMTVEEVVSSPVYMITRPNCKHFFRRLDTDEVLHNSVKKLLKQHGMIRSSVDSYVYSQYRNYYERLKILLSLRETCSCDELEKDIKETRKIIKKWLSRF